MKVQDRASDPSWSILEFDPNKLVFLEARDTHIHKIVVRSRHEHKR
jgi:hypothetical protein